MNEIKKLPKQMLDIGIASIFVGASSNIVQGSSLSTPVKMGATGLLGAGLLKKSSELLK